MTREEQIHIAMKESVTETIYSSGYGFSKKATDLLEAAWEKGAKWADNTMLEKIYNWLDSINTDYYMDSGIFQMSEMISDLKKAIEN